MTGEKVLIVDDREDNLKFLIDCILVPEGYPYSIAKDGHAALQKALAERPDLVVMDIRMPGLSGLEVLQALNERDMNVPVILMTFHGSEETAVQAFRLGAKDYIIKPFGADEMQKAIERALREGRLRGEKDELSRGLVATNQQISQRIKELNALFGIGKSVTSLLDLEKVLSRIVEAAVYLTGAEEGTLLLVDEASGELYLRAAKNLGETYARGFRLRVEDSLAGQVVRSGQAVIAQADSERSIKIKTGYLVQSVLNVPLKSVNKVIGVLSVDNRVSNRAFSANDQYLLSALADWATIAIENARAVLKLEQARDEIARWNDELEQKVIERTRALQDAQEQLIQSEKLASIGRLAAGLAHEINNPIGIILGFAQVLVKRVGDDSPLLKPLQAIERESLRCKGIVQNLLDFARRSKPALRPINVNEVLRTTCELVQHQARVGTHLVTDYADSAPLILGDGNQLQQVFTNIILNAYQSMPDGGKLEIRTAQIDKEVQISFKDTGEGIAADDLAHVFDPFFTTKEVGRGTGLGLSVSYGIVKSHGGMIDVASQQGEGSTFVVRLPIPEAIPE